MTAYDLVAANGPDRWDGPGAWWPIFPILWFLVITGIVVAVGVTARRRGRLAGRYAGERRLAERFANGEIDEAEYDARREVLRRKDG